MASIVEANSLSEINQLAANPPKYPRNPTEKKRDPLVLYLARVPGSRDIILTPLKPQLKTVTAEDVAASLYYIHLQTENENPLKDEVDEAEKIPEKTVPRKPLMPSARPSANVTRHTNEKIASQEGSQALPKRKPVAGMSEVAHISAHDREPVHRRPLGPRPPIVIDTVGRSALPENENLSPRLRSLCHDPQSNPRVDADASHQTSTGYQDFGKMHTAAQSFSLSIIRRDPSTQLQWNVGTLTGHPITEDEPLSHGSPTQRTRKPYYNIAIELTAPGYTQFRGSYLKAPKNAQDLTTSSNGCFTCDVRMEGSSSWSRFAAQHRRTRSGLPNEIARGRFSNNAPTIAKSNASEAADHQRTGSAASTSKGYAFMSPWGGRCKFTTGSAGRSLKCKHILPKPVSSPITEDESITTIESVNISELRFNLPSAIFAPSLASLPTALFDPDTKQSGISRLDRIREKVSPSKFSSLDRSRPPAVSRTARSSSTEEAPRLPPRPGSVQYTGALGTQQTPAPTKPQRSSLDESPDLDLSLGREKAGGGKRGKRAKLGKMIVLDDGFGMLDLVVGANIGIWWSVWESDHR